ncbi:MAG: BlaI/MecI/CopY family transcriptional regulator [Planctomycetota bacterium]
MRKNEHPDEKRLSGRARQVLELLYRLGEATVQEVIDASDGDIPSYSAARSILRGLVEQGRAEHEQRGAKYVYRPTVSRDAESRSALAQVLETFFDGSPERTMQALLDLSRRGDYDVDLAALERLVRRAKKEGR